jgi:hypothetical protein
MKTDKSQPQPHCWNGYFHNTVFTDPEGFSEISVENFWKIINKVGPKAPMMTGLIIFQFYVSALASGLLSSVKNSDEKALFDKSLDWNKRKREETKMDPINKFFFFNNHLFSGIPDYCIKEKFWKLDQYIRDKTADTTNFFWLIESTNKKAIQLLSDLKDSFKKLTKNKIHNKELVRHEDLLTWITNSFEEIINRYTTLLESINN